MALFLITKKYNIQYNKYQLADGHEAVNQDILFFIVEYVVVLRLSMVLDKIKFYHFNYTEENLNT